MPKNQIINRVGETSYFMKKDLKSILSSLERIEESDQGQLQGGFASIEINFSMSIGDEVTNKKACVNNCYGGNCTTTCSTNIIAGCGRS